MKIKGNTPSTNEEVVVIPRSNGEDIVFKAKSVVDYAVFDTMVPEPEVPVRRMAGEEAWHPNPEDPDFKKKLRERYSLRNNWMIIKSLDATPDLTWETVDLQKPETWNGWLDEFKKSGFSPAEVNRVIDVVLVANCLDNSKVEAARDRFLSGKAKQGAVQKSLISQVSGQQASQ